MAWYTTGTVSLTNGSTAVYGTGTAWVSTGSLNAGDIFDVGGVLYQVASIQSDTQLTLSTAYLGVTNATASYSIIPIGLLPSALAQQVKTTLSAAATAAASSVLYNTNTQGLTSVQQQNARTNIAALGQADVGQGYASISVAGGVNVILSAAQTANQIIQFTGTITASITVFFPLAPRVYIIENATAGAYTLTVAGATGAGVAVSQSTGSTIVYCDGINFYAAETPAIALSGGTAGQAPYQTGPGATGYYNMGTNITPVTGAYSTLKTDRTVLANAATAPLIVTLVTPAGNNGLIQTIKKTDSSTNTVTIVPAAGTIDGGASVTLASQYASITVQSDGVNYWTEASFSVSGSSTSVALVTNVSPIAMNSNGISTSVTIPADYNASSIGPIEIGDGVTVTISDNSSWSIL